MPKCTLITFSWTNFNFNKHHATVYINKSVNWFRKLIMWGDTTTLLLHATTTDFFYK